MKTLLTHLTVCASLLTSINGTALADQYDKQNQADAYLAHWFSIDSQEPLNLSLNRSTSHSNRFDLQFTSDDGHTVNGVMATTSSDTTVRHESRTEKLALLLHPMGIGQEFWWSDKSPLKANEITQKLLDQGFRVISLDARLHGKRAHNGFGPRELLGRAHSDQPRIYNDAIIGTVRDYRQLLDWAINNYQPKEITVAGYSMGAQMSLLLAGFEPRVDRVIAMVPPYVSLESSPVAPRNHLHRITRAQVLWLAGTKDPHSDRDKTQAAFDRVASSKKSISWFEAGHRLPNDYVEIVNSFVQSTAQAVTQ